MKIIENPCSDLSGLLRSPKAIVPGRGIDLECPELACGTRSSRTRIYFQQAVPICLC